MFFLKSMATLAKYHMVVVSGDTMMKLLTQYPRENPALNARVEDDRVRWFRLPNAGFPGTAVGIDLQIDNPVGFDALLKRIREVYHIDVKKQKVARYRPRFS